MSKAAEAERRIRAEEASSLAAIALPGPPPPGAVNAPRGYVLDHSSGYYYSSETGMYWDAASGAYNDGTRWLRFDGRQYVPI